MQRRTLLNVAAAAALSFFLPWRKAVASNPAPAPVTTATEKPGTLFARLLTKGSDGTRILEVIGPEEQLMRFYRIYQDTLWPVTAYPSQRALFMKKQDADVLRNVKSSEKLLCYLTGVGMRGHTPWINAAERAICRTGCGMTEDVSRVIERYSGRAVQRGLSYDECCSLAGVHPQNCGMYWDHDAKVWKREATV